MSISQRFEAIRIELDDHEQCHDGTHMLRHHFTELRREIAELETWRHRYEAVRLILTFHEGADMADRYAAGSPVPVSVKPLNREGEQVPDTVTWTVSSGTVTEESPDTLGVTIVNADLGTLTVTATDPNGISTSGSVEIYDGTPASLELSFN